MYANSIYDAQVDHDLNVVGALVVALGDRMRDAAEEAAGMRGALPAALVALHEWAGGRTIETLAGGLRLSHSRTVRVVDRLEAAGLAARARDPLDGRGVLVELTPAGQRAGERVLDARAAALERRCSRSGIASGASWPCSPSGCWRTTTGTARRRGDLPAMRRARVRPSRRALSR